jgi:hypothetical protein
MKAAALLAALALAACATVPPAAAGPTAGIGQVATVGPLRARPIAVTEDSRCPINVQCVWAGRLVVLTEVEFAGGSQEFRGNLTLGQPFHYGPETITLVAVTPAKVAGQEIEPRAYRFTFRFGDGP